MTGWPLVATIVLAAGTGTSVALVVDWVQQKSRKLDRDIADIHRANDADRPFDVEDPS